ncbi:MAG TPA: NblA/ycf18 family protein [Vampirovibrionales bacterium]
MESLERELRVAHFETQVDKMSLEQAQEFLKQMHRQMLAREDLYQALLKEKWFEIPPGK